MPAPDLTAADAWLAAAAPGERKRRGQWPTPWWVCEAVVALLAPDLRALPSPRVVDPACGDGRWLVAVARHAPNARLVGIDADPRAVEAARITLDRAGVAAELRHADALAPGAVPAADLVVGNPPFVRPQHLDRAVARDLWARFPLATDKCDLSACFAELALRTAPWFALVLPSNLLSLASWAAVRRGLLDAGVDAVLRLPDDTFDATVRAVVVVVARADRRRAGALTRDGATLSRTLAVGAEAWSADGPLPELPGAPLGRHAAVHMGVVCGDYDRYVHLGRQYPEDQPTCRGRDVSRWTIADRGEHLRYLPQDMLRRKPYVAPKRAALFDVPAKVVLAGTTGTVLRAAVDEARRFPLDSCYVLHPRGPELDPHALCGLLLSAPVGAWYGARFTAARVKGVEVARIPVPNPPWDEIADAARARDDAAVDALVTRAYDRSR